jgi:hypothetical protein
MRIRKELSFWLPIGLIVGAVAVVLVLLSAESKTGRVFFPDEIYYDPDRPCIVRVITWVDQNRNGERDSADVLLPGVRVLVGVHEEVSDSAGQAEYEVGGADTSQCYTWSVSIPVAAKSPAGYEFLTPNAVTVTRLPTTVSFGFTYLPGVPTITPTATSQP